MDEKKLAALIADVLEHEAVGWPRLQPGECLDVEARGSEVLVRYTVKQNGEIAARLFRVLVSRQE